MSVDLAIVGGGPVGLATAIEARAAGLEAAVFDVREPPIDKACGEGLMPDGVELLGDMGVQLGPSEAMPFSGIRYLDGDRVAEARFGKGRGLGIRRPLLHAALIIRAEAAGADLRWRTRVAALSERGLETNAGAVECRWVVGADGLDSRVRRWAGLEGRVGRHRRFGLRRHFRVTPWSDLVEVYWGRDHEAYVTPVGAREIGVAMLFGERSRAAPDFDRLLESFPRLVARLRGAEIASTDRGSGPLHRLASGVRRDNVFLVGDAAGYLDAITGEGLALGFQQARALATAVAADRPEEYERTARRLTATPFRLIRLLLFAERRPWLRRRVVAALERDPELFARLLAVHARQARPGDVGLGGATRLLGGLLVSG